jgi:hypothetical protein
MLGPWRWKAALRDRPLKISCRLVWEAGRASTNGIDIFWYETCAGWGEKKLIYYFWWFWIEGLALLSV